MNDLEGGSKDLGRRSGSGRMKDGGVVHIGMRELYGWDLGRID